MRSCLFLILSFLFFHAQAQNKIVVQVSNFKNNKGVCIICLYDNANAFSGKGAPLRIVKAPISNNQVSIQFENIPAGTYAISVIHDANNNNRFDTNFIGIPTEGYGASQNKLPFAAAPKFEENNFTVTGNSITNISIKLRYLL